jgi:hypothetical protein
MTTAQQASVTLGTTDKKLIISRINLKRLCQFISSLLSDPGSLTFINSKQNMVNFYY